MESNNQAKRNRNINIVEVGPRDGLQNEASFVKTKDKLKYIDLLIEAGVKALEVTSFVSARAIPQMKDSKELMSEVLAKYKDRNDLFLYALVPNQKGLDTALELGVTDLAFFTSASKTFNLKNINQEPQESLRIIESMISHLADVKSFRIRGYLSCVFGCPYEGVIDFKKSIEMALELKKLGAQEISFGDTIGVGSPREVSDFIQLLNDEVYDKNLSLLKREEVAFHFHDTRGLALANVYTALQQGYDIFDSSSSGLGGCPYAKGASGNLATEDLLYLLEKEKYQSGLDREKIFQASLYINQALSKNSESSSKVYKAMKSERGDSHV